MNCKIQNSKLQFIILQKIKCGIYKSRDYKYEKLIDEICKWLSPSRRMQLHKNK